MLGTIIKGAAVGLAVGVSTGAAIAGAAWVYAVYDDKRNAKGQRIADAALKRARKAKK